MEAKEKSKELVDKYCAYNFEQKIGSIIIDLENAKQCALIAVDEIQDFMIDSDDFNIYWVNYWREVKTEIEKL